MIDSMSPFGARAGTLYIGRTPYGSRSMINISPGPIRPAPLDTVRCPLYLLTKIGKKNRAFAGRSLGGPLMQPAGSFEGCLRATSLNVTQGELGAAS